MIGRSWLRGLAQRAGTTSIIFIVALVAVAAAAAGPIYYSAARTSILRDTIVPPAGHRPGLRGQRDRCAAAAVQPAAPGPEDAAGPRARQPGRARAVRAAGV